MKGRMWDLLRRTGGGAIPLKQPGDYYPALDIRKQFDDHQTMTTRTSAQSMLTPKQFELVAKALADPRRMA